jgi:membrane-bound metal-dependent hydrolase YbcI (DUF457 family)
MDILHHSAIGVIGLTLGVSLEQDMLGIFFLIGSVIPDLDAFLVLVSRSFYLKNHQGFSHSLLLIPLYSLSIVGILSFWIVFDWVNVIALLLGWMIHIGLDYSNTYGITLFYPLSKKRFSLDAIFFVDTFLLLLTASMLYFIYDIWLYLTVFLLYMVFKKWLQQRVKTLLEAKFVIPSALNPFYFYIYENQEKLLTYSYNIFSKRKRNLKEYEKLDESWSYLTQKSLLFQDIVSITKAFHITSITKDQDENITIEAKDLALRNFGGKFATTTLTFNKNKELISEYSNI